MVDRAFVPRFPRVVSEKPHPLQLHGSGPEDNGITGGLAYRPKSSGSRGSTPSMKARLRSLLVT